MASTVRTRQVRSHPALRRLARRVNTRARAKMARARRRRDVESATVRSGGGRRLVALVARALVVLATVAPGAGAASATLERGDKYVALGSSFASGPMIPEVADQSCLRSTNDYPALVAKALKLSLVDVTCGAATTDNILTAAQGDHPPQIDAVTPDTTLVTVSIGGNDVLYSGTNLICSADAQQRRSCLGTDVQPTDLEARMAALPTKLDATLQAITAKAPKATIVVTPYLRVFPKVPVPCPPSVPMDTPTLYYLVGSSDKLHTTIEQAAARNRVRFADVFTPKGHDACATPAKRWVEGAEPASPAVQFHPNARGMRAQAQRVLATLRRTPTR
jgi:lysophospholipase L1-like esterase